METVTVEVDYETIEKIVRRELKYSIDTLKTELDKVHASGKGYVFDMDYETDVIIINKHIEACELVYKYYGGYVE